MLYGVFSTLLLAVAALASPQAGSGRLPPCGNDYQRRCRCPEGTIFKNLTSYGIIGAPASEVTTVMSNFFDLHWQQGLVPYRTEGDPRKRGAVRSFNFTGPEGPPGGYYQISEVLVEFRYTKDGGFFQQYEQARRPPVVQVPGAGSYHGGWAQVIAEQTSIANETVVLYRNWRCELGETFPAALSHETGINNVSALIDAKGLHTGIDVPGFSIFHEVRQD